MNQADAKKDPYLNHTPSQDQIEIIEETRKNFILLRDYLQKTLPDGRYKSIALTELETAQLFAVRSIIIDSRD